MKKQLVWSAIGLVVLTLVPVVGHSETLHRTIVAGRAVALPLPDGYCVLDPGNPADRATYDDLAARMRGADFLAFALACSPEQRSDTAFADGQSLHITWSAARTVSGEVLPHSLDKPDFLARIESNIASALAAGLHETRQANGRDAIVSRLTLDGRDEDAVYLRLVSEVISTVGTSTTCGHQALMIIRSISTSLTVTRVCRPNDADLTAQIARVLVQRAAAANP